jgi:hypothetical protein
MMVLWNATQWFDYVPRVSNELESCGRDGMPRRSLMTDVAGLASARVLSSRRRGRMLSARCRWYRKVVSHGRQDCEEVPILSRFFASQTPSRRARHGYRHPISQGQALTLPFISRWGDEGDAKVFEMPLIRRNDRQVIDRGGRSDCRVLKTGGGSRRHRAVKHPTGFERGV